MLLADDLVEPARAQAIGERRVRRKRRLGRMGHIVLEQIGHGRRLADFAGFGT
jgi:hypothetical protein